ncbi:nucleoside phosphorylase [Zobellia uliginosa]|uniref:nucleoside phosphorylase n=1 Tax=Zobellia uliginosa TaxID=143224 RepID=UPI001C06F6C2|nr:nucleoside phosphorylase [Zobellia uliginosa]MBU2946627.1 nucleoside phosphorylase [Zobellia uliginosa]
MQLSPSELILNADKSIYHLNLLPEDIAQTIITVGDPDRVGTVSKFFDSIELKKGKREFHTHTGMLNGKRISVVSTGIGTDNIDIVFNELDALVNIDFDTRTLKPNRTVLDIVRIGTSGSIRSDIPIDSFLMSEFAMGLDGLLHFYDSEAIQELEVSKAFVAHTAWAPSKSVPYVVKYSETLGKRLLSNRIRLGTTVTNIGFYGPQSRVLRLKLSDNDLQEKLASFEYGNVKITNLEMETSGIYGLAKLLGHRAVSMNCILANRASGEFSTKPTESTEELIKYTLQKLTTS